MSAASSFVTHFDEYRPASPTHGPFPLADKSSMRDPRQAESSFLDTIVGRHDGLRAIEAGLRPGERGIVNGLQQVRAGATVEPKLVEMPARNRE